MSKFNKSSGLIILIISIICFMNGKVLAVKTNINEVSDLFEKNIEDKAALFKRLEQENEQVSAQLKSGEAYQMIEGMKDAKNKEQELTSIKDTDLDNAGREKRASKEYLFYDENELEPDYTKSGNSLHKLDAEEIAQASSSLLANLLGKLKELGIDCKSIKGPIQKEPTYHIEIKREEQRNTEYDQFFCQEPKRRYTCSDEVTLRCVRRGKRYGQWQPRTKRFDGHFLYANARNWGYARKWKVGRWGWHITPYHPRPKLFEELQVDSPWHKDPQAIINDARRLIAQQEGAAIEQISENITFPDNNSGRGIGSTIELGQSQRWRVLFQWYDFSYQYRDATEICSEWAEDWTERCNLQ